MSRMLVFRVGRAPVVEEVEDDLAAFQRIVGGYVEAHSMGQNLQIWCAEDGKLSGLAPCARWRGGVIAGDFLVSRYDATGEQIDLREEDILEAKKQIRPLYDAGFTDGFLVGKSRVW
jgi:hypothetical protein